jgi:two-component system NtrC family sensor kinase
MRRTLTISLLLLGGLLLAALLFLYGKTQAFDTTAYLHDVAVLRQIKQLDTSWELDVVRAKLGIQHNYDSLVSPLVELGTLPKQFSTAERDSRLTAMVDAYLQALTAKAELVEQFKSHNAILRNSDNFLPTAALDLSQLAGREKHDHHQPLQQASELANKILLSTLAYEDQVATADGRKAIERELEPLDRLLLKQKEAGRQMLEVFLGHVRLLIREHETVDRLLEQISEAPTASRLDAISLFLADEQERRALQAAQYRYYLFAFAGALIGLLLFASVRLVRSHAIIRRVNLALTMANENLELRVMQRTSELEDQINERKQLEMRLVQSEKHASIGQLAAGVAHEINNPLGFVSSNLGMLEQYLESLFEMLAVFDDARSSILDPAVVQAVHSARARLQLDFLREDIPQLMAQSKDGIERVSKIVQALKDFSRVDTARKWEMTNLHAGIDSSLQIIACMIRRVADVDKQFGDLPEVECLPSEINQVIMNLLVNAAQAVGPGRGRITVRSGVDGGMAWIEVEDNGCGITAAVLPHIFDPFYTTKKIGEGTGLGLSLSYGIVKAHGGRIEVASTPGSGTRMRMLLPLRQRTASMQPPAPPAAPCLAS